MSSPEAPEAPPAEAPPDAVLTRWLETIRSALGDAVVGDAVQGPDLWVRVARESWVEAARVCKEQLGATYFCFLSGLDWLDNPTQTSRYEKVWGTPADETNEVDDEAAASPAEAESESPAEVEEEAPVDAAAAAPTTGLAGGDSRFQVFARVASPTEHRGVILKADLDDTEPTVATWTTVYRGAEWHEREAWEMYGFDFAGHPHLAHLYLPGSFEGHPLRKDFPLLAREVKPWPGLVDVEPMPGEAVTAADTEGGESP